MYMKQDERRAWGPLIRAAREEAGMTQDELADAAGTTRRTVGSIERGDTVAQREVLNRILKTLDLEAPAAVATDITSFFTLLQPLLQRLSVEERAALMPQIIELVAAALQNGSSNVRPMRRRQELSDEDLRVLPSVANTPRQDMGENEDEQ